MSNDLFDKNGVWRGSLKQYYDFSKDIIEDALNNEKDQEFEEANIITFRDKIINFFLTNNDVDQKKLEDCISDYCAQLEDLLENKQNRLGLLIKPKKEHTLSKYVIEEEKCLQEAWKEGKEKNLSGDDLFNYVEKRSLELFND